MELHFCLFLSVAVFNIYYPAVTSLCSDFSGSAPLNLNCAFGLAQDWCHREVCAKGPGERCGNLGHIYGRLGKCGRGLRCSNCGKCIGCYIYYTIDQMVCFADIDCTTPLQQS